MKSHLLNALDAILESGNTNRQLLIALEHLLESINDYGGFAGFARQEFKQWDEQRLERLRTHAIAVQVEIDNAMIERLQEEHERALSQIGRSYERAEA